VIRVAQNPSRVLPVFSCRVLVPFRSLSERRPEQGRLADPSPSFFSLRSFGVAALLLKLAASQAFLSSGDVLRRARGVLSGNSPMPE